MSFALITIALDIAVILAAVAFAGLLAVSFSDTMTDSRGKVTGSARQAILDAYGGPALTAAVIAVVLAVAGYLASIFILRAGRIRRRVAVTWAAIGIAIVPGCVAFFISGAFAAYVNAIPDTDAQVSFDSDVHAATMAVGIDAVIALILGALVWWWMARVFREPVPAYAS